MIVSALASPADFDGLVSDRGLNFKGGQLAFCLMLDVDGVLVNGRPLDGRNWTHTLHEDLGINPEILVREFFEKDWHDIVTGRNELHPTLSRSMKRINAKVSAKEFISYWFKMDSRVIQSVLADCRTIRAYGNQIYLATNQEHLRAQYLMESLRLGDEVDGILYSAQAGFQKPHAGFFNYAVCATGRSPDQMLLIDDTQANIDGAKDVGWRAVHWDGSERLLDIWRRSIKQ